MLKPLSRAQSQDRRLLLWMAVIIALVFLPAVHVAVISPGAFADFADHRRFAQDWVDGLAPPSANPTYHTLAIMLYPLLGNDMLMAFYALTLLLYVANGLLIYGLYLRPVLGRAGGYRKWAVAILSVVSLLSMSAVTLLSWGTPNIYWGYIVPNVYHNPTIEVLRTFSLLLFPAVVAAFDPQRALSGRRPLTLLLTAFFAVACVFSKPNMMIALLPAVAVFAAWRLWQRGAVDWPLLLGGIVIPGSLALLFQIIFLPSSTGLAESGTFAIAPFAFAALKEPGPDIVLLPKFFLSILFPLTVLLLYRREALQDLPLKLAWLTFAVGAGISYTLVESGRFGHGNFTWSGQITLFMLMVVSLPFFMRQVYRPGKKLRWDWRASLTLTTFLLHVVSGVVWYLNEVAVVGHVEAW